MVWCVCVCVRDGACRVCVIGRVLCGTKNLVSI